MTFGGAFSRNDARGRPPAGSSPSPTAAPAPRTSGRRPGPRPRPSAAPTAVRKGRGAFKKVFNYEISKKLPKQEKYLKNEIFENMGESTPAHHPWGFGGSRTALAAHGRRSGCCRTRGPWGRGGNRGWASSHQPVGGGFLSGPTRTNLPGKWHIFFGEGGDIKTPQITWRGPCSWQRLNNLAGAKRSATWHPPFKGQL